MAKRKIKIVSAPTLPPASKSILSKLISGLLYLLYVLVWFDTPIVLSFEPCFLLYVTRGTAWYLFSQRMDSIIGFFQPTAAWFQEVSVKSVLYLLFLTLPFWVFLFWYGFTTFLLFYGGLKSCCGLVTNFPSTPDVSSEYTEFKSFGGFLQNRMRYQSYRDSLNMFTGKDKK
jgi:hypothetical protein